MTKLGDRGSIRVGQSSQGPLKQTQHTEFRGTGQNASERAKVAGCCLSTLKGRSQRQLPTAGKMQILAHIQKELKERLKTTMSSLLHLSPQEDYGTNPPRRHFQAHMFANN